MKDTSQCPIIGLQLHYSNQALQVGIKISHSNPEGNLSKWLVPMCPLFGGSTVLLGWIPFSYYSLNHSWQFLHLVSSKL